MGKLAPSFERYHLFAMDPIEWHGNNGWVGLQQGNKVIHSHNGVRPNESFSVHENVQRVHARIWYLGRAMVSHEVGMYPRDEIVAQGHPSEWHPREVDMFAIRPGAYNGDGPVYPAARRELRRSGSYGSRAEVVVQALEIGPFPTRERSWVREARGAEESFMYKDGPFVQALQKTSQR
jgi:hypothetical protein